MNAPGPERRPKHAAGDGDLPPWWTALPKRRLAVALTSTLVAVPVVVLDNLPSQPVPRASAVETVSPSSSTTTVPPTTASTTSTTVAPTSSTVTVTVPPTTTATTAPPTTAPSTTTTAAPRPTTTTTAPPAPAVAAAPAARTESGKATWYRWREGECAHKTLPKGTVVTVTNVATGATATCTVTDRGPYGGRRIIDLDDGTFAQLAPLSTGIIDVTISW